MNKNYIYAEVHTCVIINQKPHEEMAAKSVVA